MIQPNVLLDGPLKMNTWRKVAVATWSTTKDPSIYGFVDIDATEVLKTAQSYKDKGTRVTATTIVAKAVGVAIQAYPQFNSVLRFGKLYQRKNIDVFLQVSAAEDGDEDLSGMVVREINTKSLDAIAEEVQKKAAEIRSGQDPQFQKVKKDLAGMHSWVIAKFLDILSVVNYAWNIWIPAMGTPRDSLGSAMVTSVGSMGLGYAFAPLVPYSRCPMVLTVGKIEDKAVVVDGQVVVRPMLPICVTIDHRNVDGYGGSKMFHAMLDYLKKPY